MKRHVMITVWHVFAICTLFFSAVFVALYAYWTLIQPSNVLAGVGEVDDLVVVEQTVKPGGSITVESSICKNLPIKALVIRHFQDEIIYNLPEFYSNEQVGCTPNGYKIDIPVNLPPDTYTYRIEFHYKINPLKEVIYKVESNPFKVEE